MKLSDALNTATDSLYVSLSGAPIVITPKDTEALQERIRVAMAATGYTKPFEVKITLVDEGEFIDVTVKSGIAEESLSLRFETADGQILVFVDTDNSGE